MLNSTPMKTSRLEERLGGRFQKLSHCSDIFPYPGPRLLLRTLTACSVSQSTMMTPSFRVLSHRWPLKKLHSFWALKYLGCTYLWPLQGIKRLYSTKDIDRKKELRKLNHSILVNFLDLIDILIKCPESPRREEKVDDINLLFIHMHHLINEFRPHQVSNFVSKTFKTLFCFRREKPWELCSWFKEGRELSLLRNSKSI